MKPPCSSLLFLFFINSIPLIGQELLINGGFENDSSGWIKMENSSNITLSLDREIFYAGQQSARLSIKNAATPLVTGWFQTVQVTPGSDYLFSYAVKTQDVNLFAFPFLNYSKDELVLEHGFYPSSGTVDWTVYQSRIHVPEQAGTLTVFLFFYGIHGDVWFDSLSLKLETSVEQLDFNVNFAPQEYLNTYRSLCGTNAGPLTPRNPINMTQHFRDMRIPMVRTHDYHGPCDIREMFPDASADPENPDSYDFDGTDKVIESIIGSGADVFFRLGESYELVPVHNHPPANFQNFAKICLHIVKHYNHGWKDGFFFDIKYWEVWNEPDLDAFWTGTALEYAEMYTLTARTLKQWDPELKVGGPTMANLASRNFLKTFLEYIQENDAPLDFFSYHYYNMSNPWYFHEAEAEAKSLLEPYGLSHIPTILSEWNIYTYSPTLPYSRYFLDDVWNASHTTSALIYLQGSSLSQALRYRSDEYHFPLIRDDGTFSFPGMAFKALGSMNTTPFLLETLGGNQLGTTLIAGRDREFENVNIIVSHNGVQHRHYNLTLNNMHPGSVYQYKHYRISEHESYVSIATGVLRSDRPTIHIECSGPFVDHFALERVHDSAPEISYFIPSSSNESAESIHLINPSGEQAHVLLTGFSKSGEIMGSKHLNMPPFSKQSGLPRFFFPNPDETISSLKLEASGPLHVFGHRLSEETESAFWGTPGLGASLIVPHVAKDTFQFATSISLVKGKDDPSTIELMPFPATDEARYLDLKSGNSSEHIHLSELWETFDHIDWISINTDSHQLAALERFQSKLLPMDACMELTGKASKKLIFPHIASDTSNFWTGLVALNLGSTASTIRVSIYSSSGTLLQITHSEPLQPGAKKIILYDMEHQADFPPNTAWLEMSSESPLTGYVLLGSPLHSGSQTFAGYQAVHAPSRSLVFPYFLSTEVQWSGFAVVNLGIESESIKFTLYSEDGHQVGTYLTPPIRQNQKTIFLGSELFPGRAGSWVRAEGVSDLSQWAGVLLWGDHGGATRKRLAALQAH